MCSQNLKHLAMSAVSATVLSHLFLRYGLLLTWASPSSLSWLVSKPQGFSSPALELYKPVLPQLPLKGSRGIQVESGGTMPFIIQHPDTEVHPGLHSEFHSELHTG